MAKKNIKTPGELQVDDVFYMLVSKPIDEHKGSIAREEFRLFDVKKFIVDGITRDPRNPSQRIITSEGEDFHAPKDGYNSRYDEKSVIADQNKAIDLMLKSNAVEHNKIVKLRKEIELQQKCVEDVIKIYDPELAVLDQEVKEVLIVTDVTNEEFPEENMQ